MCVHRIVKNIHTALLICFVATLGIIKGKSTSILLVPKELVLLYAKRDVIYYFPMVLSDLFLGMLLWVSVRMQIIAWRFERMTMVDVMLGLVIITSALSGFFSINLDITTLSVLQLARCAAIYSVWKREKNSGISVYVLYVAASFLLFESAWGVLQFIRGGAFGLYLEAEGAMYAYGKTAWENADLLRIRGTFVDPDIFGTFMYMHSVMFLGLVLFRRYSSVFEKKLYTLCAIVSGALLFLSGNRVLYVMYIVLVVVLGVMSKRLNKLLEYVKKPAMLAVCTMLLCIIVPYVYVRIQNITDVFSRYGSGTFRVQMAEYSFKIGMNNVFGVGLGISPYYLATQFQGKDIIFGPDYPHNIFFQIFAETGVFGLAAFIGFLYVSFRPFIFMRFFSQYSFYYFAAMAYIVSACFYPLYIPLVELIGYFFLYLGLAHRKEKYI